jgi:hypothetical protein
MNEKCPSCGLNFSPEPGFYFGAMYITYAFNIAMFVGVFAFLNLFTSLERYNLLFALIVILAFLTLILLPLFYRLSRSVYLHFFGPFSFEPKHYKPGEPKRL